MYTYNKNDKSYTFSFDDIDIDKMINLNENDNIDNNENKTENNSDTEIPEEPIEHRKPPKKIEVINGGNDLDISPVTDYIEAEKPKNEKKENIVIPEDNK